jgi:hypothetical protein
MMKIIQQSTTFIIKDLPLSDKVSFKLSFLILWYLDESLMVCFQCWDWLVNMSRLRSGSNYMWKLVYNFAKDIQCFDKYKWSLNDETACLINLLKSMHVDLSMESILLQRLYCSLFKAWNMTSEWSYFSLSLQLLCMLQC